MDPLGRAPRALTPSTWTRKALQTRYARTLEQSPALLEQLQDAAAAESGLRDEVALARTLLDVVLDKFAQLHARNGKIDATVFGLISAQLKQVQSLVASDAEIDAKRVDQRMSATHVLMLVGALRDELRRNLVAACGADAGGVVDDVFERARWTGGLSDDALREALAAPAAYEVAFRRIDRTDEQVRQGAALVGLDDVAQLLAATPEDEEPNPVAMSDAKPAGAADPVGLGPPSPGTRTTPQDALGVDLPRRTPAGVSKPVDPLDLRVGALKAQIARLNQDTERRAAAKSR